MNKSELVAAMADQSGLTKADSEKALNSFMAAVTQALKKGDKVSLTGFCTVEKRHKNASKGRNPRTGAEINIAARNIVKFTAGKLLKDSIN